MYKLNKIGLIAVSVISLAACGGDNKDSVSDEPQGSGEVTYQLTFKTKWNATDFPTGFPSSPHFSPVIGATHNDQVVLWRAGEPSTEGIESVAESGATEAYNTELEQKKTDGNVENIFKGSSVSSLDNTSLQFMLSTAFPRVSAISMIAPSPDWFVGIRDVNLYVNNAWVDTLEFDLKLYDSGTDTGETFTAENADGGTGIIALLTSDEAHTDIAGGIHRSTGKVVGTIILQRVSDALLGSSDQ